MIIVLVTACTTTKKSGTEDQTPSWPPLLVTKVEMLAWTETQENWAIVEPFLRDADDKVKQEQLKLMFFEILDMKKREAMK